VAHQWRGKKDTPHPHDVAIIMILSRGGWTEEGSEKRAKTKRNPAGMVTTFLQLLPLLVLLIILSLSVFSCRITPTRMYRGDSKQPNIHSFQAT